MCDFLLYLCGVWRVRGLWLPWIHRTQKERNRREHQDRCEQSRKQAVMHPLTRVLYLILTYQRRIMSTTQNGLDVLKTLTDDVATLKQALADETAANSAAFTRLQALISNLQNSPPVGIDPAALRGIIGDIEAVTTGLQSETATANTEAPAPAPTPAG